MTEALDLDRLRQAVQEFTPDETTWQARAACGDAELGLFDPKHSVETTRAYRARVATAKAICETCPVLVNCVVDIIDRESTSETTTREIRGGMTYSERKAAKLVGKKSDNKKLEGSNSEVA